MKIDFIRFQKLRLSRDIAWLGNGPPLAEPHCGYHGEKCNGASKKNNNNKFLMFINNIKEYEMIESHLEQKVHFYCCDEVYLFLVDTIEFTIQYTSVPHTVGLSNALEFCMV